MKKLISAIFVLSIIFSGISQAGFSQVSALSRSRRPSSDASTASVIKAAPPAPKFTDAERQAELAARRAAAAKRMPPNSILLLFSAETRNYAGDVDFYYRQENNLYYLTNLKQKGSVLIIRKAGENVSEYLFVPKRDPSRETWNGKMYSNEDASRISGIRTIIDAAELSKFVEALETKEAFKSSGGVEIGGGITDLLFLLPNGDSDEIGNAEYASESGYAARFKDYNIRNARPIFDELRQIKSPYEIKLLQHAIDITIEAQMRSMAAVGSSKWEYEVHAEVDYTFRKRNADYWGYPSIVGGGPNATTLHYDESQGRIIPGQLLLMDVGAEYDHYSADITRTYPVNGKFSKEQAEIYQIVYDAQEAVAKVAKPGVPFSRLQAEALSVIENGLFRLGLITKKDGRQARRWFMHGLGHWLGMNVHDVGRYGVPLAPGMVFTNEPGIYIREDALEYLPDTPENREFISKIRPAFEKYKNIGVRIEDDLLVTDGGIEWMSKKLPRSIPDIEAFMAAASREITASPLKPE
ncbi:MAG TPA: hypothetical protein DEA22_11235 [Blastocatellia bacterium]|nr:hypothetical protein [Blastocatellia bacterium]